MQSPSNHLKLSARDKEIASLNYRRAGHSYDEIARFLNCHPLTVRDAVKRALKRLNEEINEAAEEVRRVELERLDYYLTRMGEAIHNGDTKAILAALRVSERRAKLLGLDAPPIPDADSLAKMSEEQIQEMLRQRGLIQ